MRQCSHWWVTAVQTISERLKKQMGVGGTPARNR
nr:MAG TPA: hypothetical protein [Caudoviricetes sp.]